MEPERFRAVTGHDGTKCQAEMSAAPLAQGPHPDGWGLRWGAEARAQGTSRGHVLGDVLGACCLRGRRRAQVRISNLNLRHLFAWRWLRARAMRLDQIDLETEHV